MTETNPKRDKNGVEFNAELFAPVLIDRGESAGQWEKLPGVSIRDYANGYGLGLRTIVWELQEKARLFNLTPQLDLKGVAFHADYCAPSRKLLTSGRLVGQWRKHDGISECDYEYWYRVNLPETS